MTASTDGSTTPATRPTRSRAESLAVLAGCLAASYGAAAIGNALAGGQWDGWYEALRKPAFNPPGWVFGPVWTVLYACMGVAAWLVWRRRGLRRGAPALLLFAGQLLLNAAWTPLFFGLRSPGLALVDIAGLWVMIVLTTWAFFRASRLAGWLMVPYLGWVSFAAVLNAALWRLNP
jgi:tryptophan-rich sensory protein